MCLFNLGTDGPKLLQLVARVEGPQVHQSRGGEVRRGGCAGRVVQVVGRVEEEKGLTGGLNYSFSIILV